jgi:hypothetical protein
MGHHAGLLVRYANLTADDHLLQEYCRVSVFRRWQNCATLRTRLTALEFHISKNFTK